MNLIMYIKGYFHSKDAYNSDNIIHGTLFIAHNNLQGLAGKQKKISSQ